MKLVFWAGFLAVFSAAAQTPPDQRLHPSFYLIQDFLQLTDAQARNIVGNNEQYNRWARDKQARIATVQTEITWETASENLDPHALGIRYMEVELICREMLEHAMEFRARNLALLTPDQKTKLKILEDAMLLVPVLAQAFAGNLISGIINPPQASFASQSAGDASATFTVLSSFTAPVSGCSLGFTSPIRAGNFSNPLNRKMPTPPSR